MAALPKNQPVNRSDLPLPYLREFGLQTVPAGTALPFHVNAGFELVYVFSGRYRWEVAGGRILTVRGHDLSLTLPETLHRGYLDHMSPGKILYAVVDPADPSFSSRTGIPADQVLKLADRLREIGDSAGKAAYAAVRAASLVDFLLQEEGQRCSRDQGDADRESPDRSARDQVPLPEGPLPGSPLTGAILASAVQHFLLQAFSSLAHQERAAGSSLLAPLFSYIEEHIGEELPVGLLVEKSGWSRTRLHSLFSDEVGQTPNDYIQTVRCDKACRLLAGSRRPVTEIALDLGFSSSQYFSKVFRKQYGMSPGAYRRIAAKEWGEM